MCWFIIKSVCSKIISLLLCIHKLWNALGCDGVFEYQLQYIYIKFKFFCNNYLEWNYYFILFQNLFILCIMSSYYTICSKCSTKVVKRFLFTFVSSPWDVFNAIWTHVCKLVTNLFVILHLLMCHTCANITYISIYIVYSV